MERVVTRWIVFSVYIVIILALLDWAGGADVHWPWKTTQEETRDKGVPPKTKGLLNDKENRAVLAAIFSGAVLIRTYREDQREIDRLTIGLELARQSGIAENIKRSEKALDDGKKRRDVTYELYRTQLVQSANDYSTQQHAEQVDAFKQQLAQRQDMKSIERFAELYVKQIDAYNKNHVTDEAKLVRQILDFQP